MVLLRAENVLRFSRILGKIKSITLNLIVLVQNCILTGHYGTNEGSAHIRHLPT